MNKPDRRGWIAVALLCAAAILVYGIAVHYPRNIFIYSDELRYLHIARSLLAGDGLVVRSLASNYQKILYPLCILPALLFDTTSAQLTAIGWLNVVWMASAVFPVYALCRHMGASRRRTAVLLAVAVLAPTMAVSATFMSETVFYPLSLWMVYFLCRSISAAPRARVWWCALCGVWGYILYLNKEVALYYLIAYLLTRALWLAYHRGNYKGELVSWLALAAGFAVPFVLMKMTLFAGLGNSYNQMSWLSAEQWAYMPRALALNTLFAALAFGVVPIILPLAALRSPTAGDAKRQQRSQLALMLLLCLAVGIAAVAYTITVREDLNSPSPRQHIRYLEPLLIPLLLAALNSLDEKWTPARRRIAAALTGVWAVCFVLLCRGIGAGMVDNTLLQWFDLVADHMESLPLLGSDAWMAVMRIIIAAVVLLLCAAALLSTGGGRRRKMLLPAAALFGIGVCVISGAREALSYRRAYSITAQQQAAASLLNEELYTLDGRVLFIANAVRLEESSLIDTYIDRPLYLLEYEHLKATGLLDDNLLDLAAEAAGPECPGGAYPDLAGADYLLVYDTVPVDTATLERLELPTPEGYTLYRNTQPDKIYFYDYSLRQP